MTVGQRFFGSSVGARLKRLAPNARRAVLGAAAVLALAACGGGAAIVIVLDSASAELLRGADVQIEVTLTRAGGASADVTLSITGLPANVAADFSPVTLSGGTLTSTLTLSAQAAASEGNYALTVTGTGPGLADSATLDLEVVSLTVTGRLVGVYDLPVAGVAVASQDDIDLSDANGDFTLVGLSVPYELYVWDTAAEWVHIYEGLTSSELVLVPLGSALPSGTPRGATLTGNLSGGVIPVGANQAVMVCVEGLDGVALGCDTVIPTESSYTINAQWLGGAQRQVRIHALQTQRDVNANPVSYQGYTSLDVTLTDLVPSVADLDLGSALATTTVDVDIDSPVAAAALIGAVHVGPSAALPVVLVNDPGTTYEALMPVIGDANYSFAAAMTITQFGWQGDVTGATATVTVPGEVTVNAPADLATGVTTATTFSVTNPTGGPNTFMWNDDVGNLVIAVTTMASTHTIPDVTEFGLTLPAGSNFNWQVIGQSGTSTEAGLRTISDYYNFITILSQTSPGFSGSGTFALSANREFTTAP